MTTETPQLAPLKSLTEIEARWQKLDAGPWAWRQCYETGSRVHWALESPNSAANGRVVSYLAVLRHCYPKSFGESVEDDPYLHAIAHSRDDIEWLCQQVHTTAAHVAQLESHNHSLIAQLARLETAIAASEWVREAVNNELARMREEEGNG